MTTILFLGDIVGHAGRKVLKTHLAEIVDEYSPDVVVANGENAAGGLGTSPATADEIFSYGINLLTGGNHTWHRSEILPYLDENSGRIIRPENYPLAPDEDTWPEAQRTSGKGWTIWQCDNGVKIGVVNIIGRVFMQDLVDCPFRAAASVIKTNFSDCTHILVDFHAEASSEKVAMGHFLDGKASLVLGTHTHVQTADDRVLPNGTAFISDVGMCGPEDGVIGVKKKLIIERFLTARPNKFDIAKGPAMINGVVAAFDDTDGKVVSFKRIYRRYQA